MALSLQTLFRRRVVKILPMHGVSAMGRKLVGLVASSAAGPLAISLTAAVFHCTGMNEYVQQKLKMSTTELGTF